MISSPMAIFRAIQRFILSTSSTIAIPLLIAGVLTGLPNPAGADPAADYRIGHDAYYNNQWLLAMSHLRKSARAGHPPAMVMLATILERAGEHGDAVVWYRRAAESNSAAGAYALGRLLTEGLGIEQDFEQGVMWITRAAELNHEPAMMTLANIHDNGDAGVAVDKEKAREWLLRAAREGHPPAIERLKNAGLTVPRRKPAANPPPPPHPVTSTPVPPRPTPAAPTPAPAANGATDPKPAVKEAIDAWVRHWSNQNVTEYLNAYAADFKVPAKYASRKNWQRHRRRLLRRPKYIRISITNLRITLLDENRARATFRQKYRADNYRDRTNKVLILRRSDPDGTGRWRIVREYTRP